MEMASFLRRLATSIDALNEWVGRTVAWLTLGMVVVTFLVVVLRYGFDVGWIAMQESVTYMHALVFMAGSAYTLKHNEHVRVDIFYRELGPIAKAWVNMIGTLVLLLPANAYLLWISWDYVASSWSLWEGSREAGGLPLVFLLKSFIPLLAATLVLQGLALAADSLLAILGHAPP
jgi:TRAP-type mannitol/chloroaromatic compound transport system permease small subunit